MRTLKFFVLVSVVFFSACSTQENESLTDKFNNKMGNVNTAELSSVECKICKVVKADDEASWYKFGDRKILFECRGIVKAGIELNDSIIYNAEIDEAAKSIVLTLPAPKVLAINLPPENTKLIYEKVSTTRFNFDSFERTNIIRQGEDAIRKDVSKTNILDEAEKNCTLFFSAMLSQLGFKQIIVKYNKEAQLWE